MEHHVFSFGLIIEGTTTEKVLQFKMPLKSIGNQTLRFIEQEMYYREVQTIKIYYLTLFLSWKYFPDGLFRGAPCKLILVLRKDTLFNYVLQTLEDQAGAHIFRALQF
jgi:hypothetical protein